MLLFVLVVLPVTGRLSFANVWSCIMDSAEWIGQARHASIYLVWCHKVRFLLDGYPC